jgi:hypothetical protein
MCLRDFDPNQLLRSVYGTEPFIGYCRIRGIPYAQIPDGAMPRDDWRRWVNVQAQLSVEQRNRVEIELAEVNEMAGSESLPHLLAAAWGHELPPDHIPQGAPTALWFLLHQPDAFRKAYLNQELLEACAWRNAQTGAGREIDNPARAGLALAASLREFFRRRHGTGRFCTVEASMLDGAYCFVGYVAARPHLVEAFSDDGEQVLERLRPALTVSFVYYPQDGTVLLKAPIDAEDGVLELFQRFGRTVLGLELDARCLDQTFALDRLKSQAVFLPDGDDMKLIRVKALHFRYPEREGRRQVKLDTLATDEPLAIGQLIRRHLSAQGLLDQVQVCYAELQVLLQVAHDQTKSYFIRLWPNRCNLNHTPLGERLRACLKRWGLLHVQP